MNKFLPPLCALVLAISINNGAHANIIGVLTESTSIGTFRNDVDGNPIVASFSGAQISEQFGDASFGSAAVFDTTSRVGVGVVEFQNGNASYGRQAQSVSRTVVDVSFENTGDMAVRPTLNSQITPAGLGMYVSGCSAFNLRECALRNDGDYDWQDVGENVAAGEAVVGTRFDFKVVSGEHILFSLSGGLSLILGDIDSPNTIVQDFDEVEDFLTNFRQTSPEGSQQQISFDWDATDFLVEFPEMLTLNPGEIGTITYITEVTTFSNAFCFDTGRQACPIAYGAFGDPIGRGGAAGPIKTEGGEQLLENQFFASQFMTSSLVDINGLDIGLYEFNYPTFENGQIGFRAIRGPGIVSDVQPVSAPAPIVLFMLGIAYFAMRRKV